MAGRNGEEGRGGEGGRTCTSVLPGPSDMRTTTLNSSPPWLRTLPYWSREMMRNSARSPARTSVAELACSMTWVNEEILYVQGSGEGGAGGELTQVGGNMCEADAMRAQTGEGATDAPEEPVTVFNHMIGRETHLTVLCNSRTQGLPDASAHSAVVGAARQLQGGMAARG